MTDRIDLIMQMLATEFASGTVIDASFLRERLDAAGLVVVPKEPTKAMCRAAEQGAMEYRDEHCHSNDEMAASWRAMIGAA